MDLPFDTIHETLSNVHDNDKDVLRTELNEEMRKAVMPVTIFVGVEIVLGLIGNSFVLYVFLKHYSSCTYRYFVIFLASIDILSCFTTMPGEVLTQLNWFDYTYPKEICKVKSFFNVFTVCADTFCLLTIAVDRYRNQCHPDGWQLTPENARNMGFLNCLAAFIMAIPCAILWGIDHHKQLYNGRNITVIICEKDGTYADTNHPMEYSISIECIVASSLFLMVILYSQVAKSSYSDGNQQDERRHLVETRHNVQDPDVRRNTVVMATLTVVFVITTILYFTLLSLIAANVLQKLTNSGKAVYFFFFRLYFINHVINPVVYGTLDPEFRSACTAVFRTICSRDSRDTDN